MIKQYFTDGLIQIAILLSLLRTDLNSLYQPNNELLNYPEVQDILQGQTLAVLPTSFHNQYNTINSIGGYPHPKNIDSDFYFSAIFRELSKFRRSTRVSTNIEAFLVSGSSVSFPSTWTPTVTNAPSTNNNNNEESSDVQNAQANHLENIINNDLDNNGNGNNNEVCVTVTSANNDLLHHCPFPGCDLSKEDLDLIDVLWQQDADLGISKEVFDPNHRRELEKERELGLLKEAQKQKEAEKRHKDRQQQAHQWLSQNFMQDGETGEWIPLTGHTSESSVQPQSSSQDQLEPEFTLDDALDYINQQSTSFQNTDTEHPQHSYDLPLSQLSDDQVFNATAYTSLKQEAHFVEGLIPETEPFSSYPHFTSQSQQVRFEQGWQELVELLHSNTPVSSTINNDHTTSMPPIDTQIILQEQDLPDNFLYAQSMQMNETVGFLVHNSTSVHQENSTLRALLSNATMPVPVDNGTLSMMEMKNVLNETTAISNASTTFSPTSSGNDILSPLDWDSGELFFPNIIGLTAPSAEHSTLDTSDLLMDFLPDDDLHMTMTEDLQHLPILDDATSDSAISMGSCSPSQDLNETMDMSPFEGLEGATGGSDYDSATGYGQHDHTRSSSGGAEDDGFNYSSSSYGSPASVQSNFSTGSNDTEHSNSRSSTATNHVHHNHTYPTQPGQIPREVKKYAKKDGPRQKGPVSRDQRRAEELKIPIPFQVIVDAPVEEFNELLAKHKLAEKQLSLIRDIRRRGKNKVAAQNCRKRKLDVIFSLEDEMTELQLVRDKLLNERRQIELQTRQAKDKYSSLYDHIFRSLRDEHGHPYDASLFSLQQSSDGNVFLVPRNYSIATTTAPSANTPSEAHLNTTSQVTRVKSDKGKSEHKRKNKE